MDSGDMSHVTKSGLQPIDRTNRTTRRAFAPALSRFALKTTIIVLVTAPTGPLAADPAVPALEMVRPLSRQIVGTWQLSSIYEENAGGEDIYQFGSAPIGQFITDNSGHFSLQIISQGGRRYAASNCPVVPRTGGLVEAVTYFGAYYVDRENSKLILHASHCRYRSCDKSQRIASVKIGAGEMELVSAAVPSLTDAYYSRTVWRRVCCE
jgi:hypothetical protein